MKPMMYLMLAALLAIGTTRSVSAEPGKKHATKYQRVRPRDSRGPAHVVFLPSDLRVIREYYGPRYRNLPPGLQKKYARTGQLPPGWQKKVEPFPFAVERRLALLPAGYHRGFVDGHAVIYDSRHVIVDRVRPY
jgi:hypothetical protein